MNLTQRDKKLLIGLGVFIFVVVFIKFLLFPKFNNISTLKTDIDSLKNTYNVNLTYKAKTESLDSEIKILSQKLTTLRATYPPSINSDELLIILKKLISDSKLEVNSLSFEKAMPIGGYNEVKAVPAASENGAVQTAADQKQAEVSNSTGVMTANPISSIQNYFYLWGLLSQQTENEKDEIIIPDGKGYSVGVKLEAKGTNEEIKTFFKGLYKLSNKAICKNISISQLKEKDSDSQDNELKLSAEISFLGIMDKGAGEYLLLKDGYWSPLEGVGKTNIFEEYSGYERDYSEEEFNNTVISTEEDSDTENIAEYDFAVTAGAYGGGLAPSVSISCTQPQQKGLYTNPVVYGDSKTFENAELFIEQKSGRYYCKFKTDHEAYPDKQYSTTFEFIPVGKELRLFILSSARKNVEDLAGVNLSIINNTNRKLIYVIRDDDKSAPRVKIDKTTGSVENEKK